MVGIIKYVSDDFAIIECKGMESILLYATEPVERVPKRGDVVGFDLAPDPRTKRTQAVNIRFFYT